MSAAAGDPGYDLEVVRANVAILDEWTYLNTGTVGVMAEPVLARHLDYIGEYERGGHTAQGVATAAYERSRAAVATLIGADPSEVGLNRNATDGINWIAATYPLQPGDEVITSDQEHPAMIYPWLAACQRAGATLRYAALSHDRDALADAIRSALSPSTRLVAFSHVSCETGTRVPVDVIREVVGPDVHVLIDASQSVGQFPVDVRALQADFVIGNGHKWLAGPKGTGFAWFHPDALELVPPVYFGDGAMDPRWSRSYYQATPAPEIRFAGDASRFEYGTRNWHTFGALADAIEYQAGLGWQRIFDHVARMSALTKDTLAEIPGVEVVTPERWEDSSGLVTFTISGLHGGDVYERLWQQRIAQRPVEVPSAVRVSCTYFTSEDDVLRLRQEVDRIARGG